MALGSPQKLMKYKPQKENDSLLSKLKIRRG